MICNIHSMLANWAILLGALLAVQAAAVPWDSYAAEPVAQRNVNSRASGPAGRELLDASGVKGGLVVHLGCGDGNLAVSLAASDAYVVQGLDTEPATIEAARGIIHARSLTGPVSVARFDGRWLPYVDGLVNLLIVSARWQVTDDEFARVMAPGACVLVAPGVPVPDTPHLASVPGPAAGLGGWARFTKTVPSELDEWTHFLHGPDGHVMSNDTAVGPPWHIQWIGAPGHARSHTHLTTVNVMVSAGGRLFYIVDESPTALPDDLPSRWALVARDAFSGIELWRRPLRSWQPYFVKDRNAFPADLHRRLVAARDVVFATLSIKGPVSALDAADGRTLRTYAGTEKTEDIVHEDGILYLSVNTAPPDQIDRLGMAYRHVEPTKKRVLAIETGSGRVLWEKADGDTDGLMPMTLAVKNDRLYFQNPSGVVCLAKATGQVLWTSVRPSDYFRPGWSSPTLVAFDDVVISADRQSGPGQKLGKDKFASGGFSTGDLVALSAATGQRLWSAPCAEGCRAPTDVFSLAGRLWFGKALERNPPEYGQVHDLLTGKVLTEFPPDQKWPSMHHHRCYRDKATANYILGGRTGVEFIRLDTGEVMPHNWLRGNCKFGVLPANGLLYLPPEQCGCYIESKLTGFHALAPRRASTPLVPESHPLEHGPASGALQATGRAAAESGDWPTFRADNTRTGRARTSVPLDKLAQTWRTRIGGRLTQPVLADGRLLVAASESHTLHVLDARTGRPLWQFVAGARIDSPPTIARGLAVFGCRDGWVYALRCADGQLAWRWRAAPGDRLLVDNGQLESVWPVHGSVLVRDNSVYLAAGRSSYVDGGVRMARLDLVTGQPLLVKTFHSRDPKTGETLKLYEPFKAGRLASMEMPGVLPDVLSSDGDRLWMRGVTFDTSLAIQPEFPRHLFSSMGFLDDSWWELSYWMYGEHMFSGRSGIAHAVGLYPTARIMVCGEENVYGWQEGYEGIRTPALVASAKAARRETVDRRGKKTTRLLHQWSKDLPLHVFGLVLAGDTLFTAGPPRIDAATTRGLLATLATDEHDLPPALRDAAETFAGSNGGLLCAVRTSDGQIIRQLELPAAAVFDGLIAANGRLYVSLRDGSVTCLHAGASPEVAD